MTKQTLLTRGTGNDTLRQAGPTTSFIQKSSLADGLATEKKKGYATINGKKIKVASVTPKELKKMVSDAVKGLGMPVTWAKDESDWSGDSISYEKIKNCEGFVSPIISVDLIKGAMAPITEYATDKQILLYLNKVETRKGRECEKSFSFNIKLSVDKSKKEGFSDKLKLVKETLKGTDIKYFQLQPRLILEGDFGRASFVFDIPFFKTCEQIGV